MADITNTFTSGVMNKDLDERLIPMGTYRDALNIDVDVDNGSNVGTARNTLGNSRVSDITMTDRFPSGLTTEGATTIGSEKFESLNLIYWLVAANEFDGVFEFDELTGVTTRVLLCTKASINTPSILGFNKRNIVTGINYINGYLYWTDGNVPPRKINISRCKSYGVDDPRIINDIDVIIEPPLNAPTIELINDTTLQSNNISEKFLSFFYRYKNFDNQYSAMSPASAVAFEPGNYEIDFTSGNNESMVNRFNTVKIKFNTGSVNVKEVQILMSDTRSGNISVVESISKESEGYANDVVEEFTFYNNKVYTIIDQTQINRLFDNVPLKAKAQEIIGNRLAYGNYTQFFNLKDVDGRDIDLDLKLSYESTPTMLNQPIQTWRSDRDYEAGVVYLDKYGRQSTTITSANNTVYIPPTQSDKGNSLSLSINNKAPEWASNYRIVIKQSKKGYYNIFPIGIYSYGDYRYILINTSDRDKFIIGKYIIFKSTASGPTYSNKKYKVLDLEIQPANFIIGSSNVPAGLYIKIEVDNPTELSNAGVFTYNSEGIGGGYVTGTILNLPKSPVKPLYNQQFAFAENPIHYGSGNPGVVSVVNSTIDRRFTIEIKSSTEFDVYTNHWQDLSSAPNYIGTFTILANTDIPIAATGSTTVLTIQFSTTSGLVIGDRWVINTRSNLDFGFANKHATAIVPGANWSPNTTGPEVDRVINAGAIITLRVTQDEGNPYFDNNIQPFPPSSRQYANIEEWWWESGARDLFSFKSFSNVAVNGSRVSFARGKEFKFESGQNDDFDSNRIQPGGVLNSETINYPVRMLIHSTMPENTPTGSGVPLYSNNNQNKLRVLFSITQQDTPNICETEADENPVEVFHELSKTFPIVNGLHNTLPLDNPGNINQTLQGGLLSPAKIKINNTNNKNSDYNAWSFGNGLESYRIKDDFNAPTFNLSPRVTSTTEDYRELDSFNAICYSGIFGENTGVNRLNEFNLSTANFKYLDREYGSVQKLYSRDSDLLVFQESKVSRLLYEKNILFDAVGGGSVASVSSVLGNQQAFPGEYGISQNPESFAEWGNSIFFTDARRGAVLQLLGIDITPISDYGMIDHFKELMRDRPNSQKLGAYDPDKNHYVLSSNETPVLNCRLDLSITSLTVSGMASVQDVALFNIYTSSAWSVSVVDNGFGTSWVDQSFISNGIGDAIIFDSFSFNNTGASRSVRYVVSYCDGLTKSFLLTQGRGREVGVILTVIKR
jgi:hypothetical protein